MSLVLALLSLVLFCAALLIWMVAPLYRQSSRRFWMGAGIVALVMLTLALYILQGASIPLAVMASNDPKAIAELELTQLSLALNQHPEDEKLQKQYVVAYSLAHEGVLDEDTGQLALILVDNNPTDAILLNLLALNAYQQQDFDQAIQIWQQLQRFYPTSAAEDSPITAAIKKAQAHL